VCFFAAFATHIGDNDNIFNSNRFNNSIRYASPIIEGLTFAGSYAFSNEAGASSNNNGYSFGANYTSGQLKLGAAFTQFNHPSVASNLNGAVDDDTWGFSNPFVKSLGGAITSQQRIMGVGASYNFNVVQVAANYTNVLYDYLDSTGLRLQNAELTVTKQITPTVLLGAGYIFTAGNYSADQQPRYHQLNLGVVYSLSKRTDLWLVGMYQHAAGDAHHCGDLHDDGVEFGQSNGGRRGYSDTLLTTMTGLLEETPAALSWGKRTNKSNRHIKK